MLQLLPLLQCNRLRRLSKARLICLVLSQWLWNGYATPGVQNSDDARFTLRTRPPWSGLIRGQMHFSGPPHELPTQPELSPRLDR